VLFEARAAADLLQNVLARPGSNIRFQNIHASSHACFNMFTNGHALETHQLSGEYVLPESGIIMSSGSPADFCRNDSDENTNDWKEGGDANLTAVAQRSNIHAQTYDACIIEFEFKCADNFEGVTSEVSFDYVFGSEEYFEYNGSSNNDVFAFFMNGENIAKLPDGETIVSINTVNNDINEEYFISNDI